MNTPNTQPPQSLSIREVTGYTTSTDYAALCTLMESQSIVCLVRYGDVRRTPPLLDIAKTCYHPATGERQISARGILYVSADSVEFFIQQCEEEQVQWFVSNPGTHEDRAGTLPDVVKGLQWCLAQMQGDSGTGDAFWDEYPEYRAAKRALETFRSTTP